MCTPGALGVSTPSAVTTTLMLPLAVSPNVPTISAGEDFWARPELRLFVTYGKWNDGATAALNANNNGGPVFGNNTSGTSAGFQVESWF